MNASILFQLICAWGIIIGVTAITSNTYIKYKQSDIDKCEKYDAVGAMRDSHKPVLIKRNATEMTQNNETFNFEFYVQGTKKANVYFSPEPAGSFENRKGYGVLVEETSDNNVIVIRKYEPYRPAIELQLKHHSQLSHIRDIFQVNVKFQRRYNETEICVHVEYNSACATDRDPIRVTYATFFRDESATENSFYYNCRPPTAEELYQALVSGIIVFAILLLICVVYVCYRCCRS